MSWASQRQSQYVFGLVIFLALVAGVILYPTLTKQATCSDGKQNGTETGVDCGGACSRVCSSQAAEPVILWSRAFNVVGSTYNFVALIENQNKDAALYQVSYEFRAYDENNTLIGTRMGTTYLPANQQFAIFEPRFDSGTSSVKSVAFNFTSPFVWIKKQPTIQSLPISVKSVVFTQAAQVPTLTAQVVNDSIYELPAFNVVTILYDSNHTAVNASRTQSGGLKSNSSAGVTFTWPASFSEVPATEDVLVEVNPFTTPF
jgi:hypothetical protein